MNYYEHHLGDYAKDTGHLSMLEHGAYRILLDRYYSTECGIPADQAHRLARARSEEECRAVDVVLEEFFELVNGVWVHRRVEREIESARKRIGAAQENGKKGGRPPKKPRHSDSETQQEPGGLSVGSDSETQQKAHQSPSTNHHLPKEEDADASSAPSRKIALDADGNWTGISTAQRSTWSTAYPALSLDAELAKAAAWILANPKNKKSNYARFLTNWLSRAQDRARPTTAPAQRGFDPLAYVNRNRTKQGAADVIDV